MRDWFLQRGYGLHLYAPDFLENAVDTTLGRPWSFLCRQRSLLERMRADRIDTVFQIGPPSSLIPGGPFFRMRSGAGFGTRSVGLRASRVFARVQAR